MKTSVKISVFFPPKNVICFSKACKNIQMDTIYLHNIKHPKIHNWLEYQREVPLIYCYIRV